jgi:predicted transcriptional regulator
VTRHPAGASGADADPDTSESITRSRQLNLEMDADTAAHHRGGKRYRNGMAMTIRLPDDLDAELRIAASEDHRSVHQTILLAVEMYLAGRETAEIRADPDALRALAEAREAVGGGDVVYGEDAVHALVRRRRTS